MEPLRHIRTTDQAFKRRCTLFKLFCVLDHRLVKKCFSLQDVIVLTNIQLVLKGGEVLEAFDTSFICASEKAYSAAMLFCIAVFVFRIPAVQWR